MKKFKVGDTVRLKVRNKYGPAWDKHLIIQKVNDISYYNIDYTASGGGFSEEELEFYRKFKIGDRVKHVNGTVKGTVTSYTDKPYGTFVQLNGTTNNGYLETNLVLDNEKENEMKCEKYYILIAEEEVITQSFDTLKEAEDYVENLDAEDYDGYTSEDFISIVGVVKKYKKQTTFVEDK